MTLGETYSKLRSIEQLKRRILCMEIRRDELQACLLPPGLRYDKDIVQTSPEDKMARYAVEVADLDRDIIKAKKRRADLISFICSGTDRLRETDRIIILMYYVQGSKMDDIAKQIHYNRQYCYELKRQAVQHLSCVI